MQKTIVTEQTPLKSGAVGRSTTEAAYLVENFSYLRNVMLKDSQATTLNSLINNELDLARASALAHDSNSLLNALSYCAKLSGAAAIYAKYTSGHILIENMSEQPITIPLNDNKEDNISISQWMDGVWSAIVLDDKASLSLLCSDTLLDLLDQTETDIVDPQNPDLEADTFWHPYAQAMVCLIKTDIFHDSNTKLRELGLHSAQQALDELHCSGGYFEFECLQAVDIPVVQLIGNLLANKTQAWSEQYYKALSAYKAYYSQEDNASLLPSGLPLALMALARIASAKKILLKPARALHFPLDLCVQAPLDLSEYLAPVDAHPNVAFTMTYHFPRHSIVNAQEAHWFLDLQGFHREGRTHALLTEQEYMFARYSVPGTDYVPPTVAEFVLAEPERLRKPNMSPPAALDPGELVQLAETLTAKSDATNADLADAVLCIQTVIERIPEQQDCIPKALIARPESLAYYQAEPERFRRDRLITYKNTLQRILDDNISILNDTSNGENPSGLGIKEKQNEKSEQDAVTAFNKEVPHLATGIIEQQVMPVLNAIHEDTNEQNYIRTLKPSHEDIEQVFDDEAVDYVKEYVDTFWSRSLIIQAPKQPYDIQASICPAGMFYSNSPMTKQFPSGYIAIAAWLKPACVWVSWRTVGPGERSGQTYDGLVFVNQRWVWFPKVHKMLAKLGNRPIA